MTSEPRGFWRVTWKDALRSYEERVGPYTAAEVAAWAVSRDKAASWEKLDIEPLPSVDD